MNTVYLQYEAEKKNKTLPIIFIYVSTVWNILITFRKLLWYEMYPIELQEGNLVLEDEEENRIVF